MTDSPEQDPANYLAEKLKAHHENLSHSVYDHETTDESMPGQGKDHFVHHEEDDGNEAIQIRNAVKPGHVHYMFHAYPLDTHRRKSFACPWKS